MLAWYKAASSSSPSLNPTSSRHDIAEIVHMALNNNHYSNQFSEKMPMCFPELQFGPVASDKMEEEFEDTKSKRVIRIRKSKKDRQRNGQKKKGNYLQNIHIKLKIE